MPGMSWRVKSPSGERASRSRRGALGSCNAAKANKSRQRIVRDETILDLAVHAPRTVDELKQIRNLGEDVARGKLGQAIMAAIERAGSIPKSAIPAQERKKPLAPTLAPVVEMMKLLLRIVASENEVAGRLIASPEDIEEIARDDKADVPPLKGWRMEVFGKQALELKHGRIALCIDKGTEIIRMPVD